MNYSLPISKILLLILLFIIAYTYNAKAENIFFDDFETDKGWQVNPNSTDNATTGMWERENPQSTEYRGRTIQLGETISGNYCLVTGHLAGSSVGTYDIDNGVTSIK